MLFFIIAFVALGLAGAGLVGLLIVALCLPSGPIFMSCWAIGISLVIAVICYLLGNDFSLFDRPNFKAMVPTVLCVIAVMAAPGWKLYHGHAEAAYYRQMAPLVSSFGMQHWAELGNADQMYRSDFDRLLANSVLVGDERTYVQFMRDNIDSVGHAVSCSTTYVPIITTVNNITTTTMTPVTSCVYAVNNADLTTYPARVNWHYRNW